MSTHSRLLTLSVVAGLAVPLLATGAGAAAPTDERAPGSPTWGPVKILDDNPWGESLAVDGRGAVTVVWATGPQARAIVAVRRTAGGHWGRPVRLGHGSAPQVAADRRGDVTVVWITQRQGHTDGVAAVRRPAGGHWSEPVRLSDDLAVPGYVPGRDEVYGAVTVDLAVSPGGAAVAAWAWGSVARGKAGRIQSAYRPAGRAWDDPVDVTRPVQAWSPEVTMDAEGGAVLVYGRQPFGHPQALLARERPVGGAWTRAERVTAEGYSPVLASAPDGSSVVAFTPDFESVDAAFRPAGGHWRPARHLSPAGASIADYEVAMDDGGSAVLALARAHGRVDLVRRPAGGPWSGLDQAVPAGSTVYDVLLALNGPGDLFLGWGGYDLRGAYQPHGGTLGEPATISPDAGAEVLEETHAVVTPAGDVVVLWKQEERPLKVRVLTAS